MKTREKIISVICFILAVLCAVSLFGCSDEKTAHENTDDVTETVDPEDETTTEAEMTDGAGIYIADEYADFDDTPAPSDNGNGVSVSMKTAFHGYSVPDPYDGGTLYYRYDGRYPCFTFESAEMAGVQDKINAYFEDLQETDGKSMMVNPDEYTLMDDDKFRTETESVAGFDITTIDTTFETVELNENFCSIRTLVRYYPSGAAHGGYYCSGHVIDLKTGETVAMSALFNDTHSVQYSAAKYIYAKYKEKYGDFSYWNIDTISKEIDVGAGRNWYIQGDRLFIDYGVWELGGSFGDGGQNVSVPLDIFSVYWTDTAELWFSEIAPKIAPGF